MERLYVLSILALLTLTAGEVISSYDLTILHTNDVHARLDEAYKYGGVCSPANSADGKCVGGSARLATKIKELRAAHPNSLLLDGGDQFQGTFWFYVFKGMAAAQFMKKLGYNAMAIGNHEFDEGLPTLQKFINNVSDSFDILSSNIDGSNEPSLTGYKPWTIEEVGGRKIGIIGYTTTDTPTLVSAGNVGRLVFRDVIESVRSAVSAIQSNDSTVNIIIAVGHAGFEIDKQIAKEVRGIDIVVGGHTNTFLYTGDDLPASEKPDGQYPFRVEQDGGGVALCVQAYTFTKYLGHLNVKFNSSGVVSEYSGNPILLDNSVAKDDEVEAMLQPYKDIVAEEGNRTIARAAVKFDSLSCRKKDCNFGNFITDAWIHSNIIFGTDIKWSRAAIALANGGSIRAPIERGDLSYGDLLTSLPFGNDIVALTVTGATLKKAFENSAVALTDDAKSGRFMQVSGAKVVYNLSKEEGERVVDLQLLCLQCEIPSYSPMDPQANYSILTTSFLSAGGDGYDMFVSERLAFENLGLSEAAMVERYMSTLSVLYPAEEGRVRFKTDSEADIGGECPKQKDCPDPVDCSKQQVGDSYAGKLYSSFLVIILMLPVALIKY